MLAQRLRDAFEPLGLGPGLVAALRHGGDEAVLGIGSLAADAVVEVGSIGKTFTGLLLAASGLALETEVSAIIPAGFVAPRGVRLWQLAAHVAGIPRLPENLSLAPEDIGDPYATYGDVALRAALLAWADAAAGQTPAVIPAPFLYSNIGAGFLGWLLARHAALAYDALIRRLVTGPLGMLDTGLALTPAQEARFATPHEDGKPVPHWNFTDVFAGAGGLRSTAADMLRFACAFAAPATVPALSEALIQAQTPRVDVAERDGVTMRYALGLGISDYADGTRLCWHNGGTGGFTSFVGWRPGGPALFACVNDGGDKARALDDAAIGLLRSLS